MRPVVKIHHNDATGRHVARCATGDCDWTYANPVKAACEEQARWHRQQHRQQQR